MLIAALPSPSKHRSRLILTLLDGATRLTRSQCCGRRRPTACPEGIKRVTPVLQFQNDAAEVTLAAVRQDAPPKLVAVCYEIITDSPEIEQRLQLLHRNIPKYG